MIQLSKISVTASDVTGQKRVRARDIPVDSTIGELLDGITPRWDSIGSMVKASL